MFCKTASKEISSESLRVGATGFGRDARSVLLERDERITKRASSLLAEQHAGRLKRVESANGLSDASSLVGDDRLAAGLGLEWCYAEIFFCGKDECSRRAQDLAQAFARHFTDEFDIGPARFPSSAHFRSRAGYDELALGHRTESLDDEIDALVSHPV